MKRMRVCLPAQRGMRTNRKSERMAGPDGRAPRRAQICPGVLAAVLPVLLFLVLGGCTSDSSKASVDEASASSGVSSTAATTVPGAVESIVVPNETPAAPAPSPAPAISAGEENPPAPTTEGLPEPVYPSSSEGGFGEIVDYLSGASDVIPAPCAEEDRERLIAQALEEGILLSFDSEGAMHLADPQDPAAVIHLYPDGSYDGTDGNGSYFAVDYRWPDNALSRLLPTAEIPVLVAYTGGHSLTVYFENASYEELVAYSEALWDMGFTEEPMEQMEEGVFAFHGVNEQGWAASIVYHSAGLETPFAGVYLTFEEEEHQRSLGVPNAWPQAGPLSALPAPTDGQDCLLFQQQNGEERMAIILHAKPSDYERYHTALLEAGYTNIIEEEPHYFETADQEGVPAIVSYYEGTILISIGIESENTITE